VPDPKKKKESLTNKAREATRGGRKGCEGEEHAPYVRLNQKRNLFEDMYSFRRRLIAGSISPNVATKNRKRKKTKKEEE